MKADESWLKADESWWKYEVHRSTGVSQRAWHFLKFAHNFQHCNHSYYRTSICWGSLQKFGLQELRHSRTRALHRSLRCLGHGTARCRLQSGGIRHLLAIISDVSVYFCTYIHTYIHMYIYNILCMYVCMHACMYVCQSVSQSVSQSVCMYVCMHVCM